MSSADVGHSYLVALWFHVPCVATWSHLPGVSLGGFSLLYMVALAVGGSCSSYLLCVAHGRIFPGFCWELLQAKGPKQCLYKMVALGVAQGWQRHQVYWKRASRLSFCREVVVLWVKRLPQAVPAQNGRLGVAGPAALPIYLVWLHGRMTVYRRHSDARVEASTYKPQSPQMGCMKSQPLALYENMCFAKPQYKMKAYDHILA